MNTHAQTAQRMWPGKTMCHMPLAISKSKKKGGEK